MTELTYDQTFDLLKYYETCFKGKKITEDTYERDFWHDKLKFLDLALIKATINDLNKEHRSQTCRKKPDEKFWIPPYNEFIARYMKLKSVRDTGGTIRSETKCCDKGLRWIIKAGVDPYTLNPMSRTTKLCKDDPEGTIYRHFAIARVPCKCPVGVGINNFEGLELEARTLEAFYKISFNNWHKAHNFLKRMGVSA